MKLLEFPHSHYCEKARWALDLKGIAYERVPIMPGPHVQRLKKQVSGTSVPVLIDGQIAIQGSSLIIDYLDQRFPDCLLTPLDERDERESRALEQEFDQCFGVNIRRALYWHLLPHAGFIRHCFMSRSPWYERWAFAAIFPVLRRRVVTGYGVNPDEVETGLNELRHALDRWDPIVKPGEFLIGETLSRADIALASMLYFAALPEEFESPWPRGLPNEASKALLDSVIERPTLQWVKAFYLSHRSLNARHGAGLIPL